MLIFLPLSDQTASLDGIKSPNFCFTRHTEELSIFLPLQTKFTNSILFYASAEHPERQFLSVTLTAASTIYVEANFGSGAVGEEIGGQLSHMTWNTITLVHQHDTIQVSQSISQSVTSSSSGFVG